jgi:hypothetical protein
MQNPTKVTIDLDKEFIPTEYEDGGRVSVVTITPAGEISLDGECFTFSQKVFALFPQGRGFRFEFEPTSIRLLVGSWLPPEIEEELRPVILAAYPDSETRIQALRA